MISTKYSIIFAVLFTVYIGVHGDEKELAILDKIYNEMLCVHQGGLCVLEKDCPTGHLTAVKGLCPEQRGWGVECCYGISLKETRCSKRGGGCVPKNHCNKSLQDSLATDCEGDDACCIFVN